MSPVSYFFCNGLRSANQRRMTLHPTPLLGSNCVGRDCRSGFEANQRLASFALVPSVSSAHFRNVLDDESGRTHFPNVISAFVLSIPVSALGFRSRFAPPWPSPILGFDKCEHPNAGPSEKEGDEKLLRC